MLMIEELIARLEWLMHSIGEHFKGAQKNKVWG